MTILKLMRRFRDRQGDTARGAFAPFRNMRLDLPPIGETAERVASRGRRIVGINMGWFKQILAGALALGSGMMVFGQRIVDVGFRVTLYGFGLWGVSSAVKYLARPVLQMAVAAAAGEVPAAMAASPA